MAPQFIDRAQYTNQSAAATSTNADGGDFFSLQVAQQHRMVGHFPRDNESLLRCIMYRPPERIAAERKAQEWRRFMEEENDEDDSDSDSDDGYAMAQADLRQGRVVVSTEVIASNSMVTGSVNWSDEEEEDGGVDLVADAKARFGAMNERHSQEVEVREEERALLMELDSTASDDSADNAVDDSHTATHPEISAVTQDDKPADSARASVDETEMHWAWSSPAEEMDLTLAAENAARILGGGELPMQIALAWEEEDEEL